MNLQELMNYIRERKKFTIPEVQQKFGLKYGETRQAFQTLQGDNKIKYVGGVTFEWCLFDDNERLEFIRQRRKELEERRAKLRESVEQDDDDDFDLDAFFADLDDEDDDGKDENPDSKIPVWKSKTATKGKDIVTLRNVIQGDEFKKSKGNLTFVVGRDADGKDAVADLVNLPHLLIAGMPGSGKTTVIHSLIVSLAKKYSPDYVRFLLVDTRFVEMSRYDGMPHMLTRESIKSCNDALSALDYLTAEMNHRYDLFRSNNVGNLVEYNAISKTKLPYIVFVVDELADFMSGNRIAFEARLLRLTQKCRASGIHLVLATQCPDVKTITGAVKASMPSRIALRVCSHFDSVTILGAAGAEQLQGRGDMIFCDAVSVEPRRIQGAFVTSDDIRIAVNELKKTYVCKFDKEVENRIFPAKKEATATVAAADNSQADPLCRRALKFWLEKQGGRASIASIQRNLGIGFNRAGRIMDYCQKMGYVEQLGPNDPSIKPLMVLVILDDLPLLFPDQED